MYSSVLGGWGLFLTPVGADIQYDWIPRLPLSEHKLGLADSAPLDNLREHLRLLPGTDIPSCGPHPVRT